MEEAKKESIQMNKIQLFLANVSLILFLKDSLRLRNMLGHVLLFSLEADGRPYRPPLTPA